LKDRYLYIVDIRFRQEAINLLEYINIRQDFKILSLSPYSSFLLESLNLDYITYHNAISKEDFFKKLFREYKKIENSLLDMSNIDLMFAFREIATIKSFELYLYFLFQFLESKKKSYKLIYIGDTPNLPTQSYLNSATYFYNRELFEKIFFIDNRDKRFYLKNRLKIRFLSLFRKNFFKKLYFRFLKRIELNYDNIHFFDIYSRVESVKIESKIEKKDISKLIEYINGLEERAESSYIKSRYLNLKKDLSSFLLQKVFSIKFHPFTFLANYTNYRDALLYKRNGAQRLFMQHGNYMQENIFLKYNEIYPATINFVFNDFTKDMFLKRGAKEVYSVGSINFNYKIKSPKRYKYDFVYIAYCTSYGYSGFGVFSKTTNFSIDADDIYRRHKSVIELFGRKLKDKRLVIKLQYGIVNGAMSYIPLLELSREYKNIKIEFIKPLSKLFSEARYIISDYLSSEFINRELHYKRDILLFKNSLGLDSAILSDIEKLYILVDNIDDLERKILNIQNISALKSRDKSLIEYYSSKDIDTKSVVWNILNSKLNLQ